MSRAIIAIMAKRPFPGQTKTRLTPPFSPALAAQLYECLLKDTVRSVATAANQLPMLTPAIAFAPADAEPYFAQLVGSRPFQLLPQVGASLGQRLDHVLSGCLHAGYEMAAAINSDSPSLPPAFLAQAFAELQKPTTDLVLGPVSDGGYYLIGWKRPLSDTVLRVQMSTPHVLDETLAVADEMGLKTVLLPTWHDIDDIDDLRRVQANGWAEPQSHLVHFLQTAAMTAILQL